ncbi:MAG: hypothetical protein ACYC6H_09340, partial [Bellilinea sp.]
QKSLPRDDRSIVGLVEGRCNRSAPLKCRGTARRTPTICGGESPYGCPVDISGQGQALPLQVAIADKFHPQRLSIQHTAPYRL